MVTEIVLFESKDLTALDFYLWCWMKNYGYTIPIARSHSGCCCLNKEAWRSTQTNNTRSSHTSCKVRSRWLGIFENLFWTVTKFLFLTDFSF